MHMDVGLVLGIAQITMEQLIKKTELRFWREERWIDEQTYLSQTTT